MFLASVRNYVASDETGTARRNAIRPPSDAGTRQGILGLRLLHHIQANAMLGCLLAGIVADKALNHKSRLDSIARNLLNPLRQLTYLGGLVHRQPSPAPPANAPAYPLPYGFCYPCAISPVVVAHCYFPGWIAGYDHRKSHPSVIRPAAKRNDTRKSCTNSSNAPLSASVGFADRPPPKVANHWGSCTRLPQYTRHSTTH